MAHQPDSGDTEHAAGPRYHWRPPRIRRDATPKVIIPPDVSLILERLESAPDGVGSGTLQLYLRDRGISASQPTVGRILRELDHEGLTEKVSNRGRVLTASGRRRLELSRFEATRRQWADELLRTAPPASRDNFLPLLDALRTIECEIARRAAEHATDAQLKEMEEVVEQQRKNLESPMRGAKQGTDFHHLLAKASQNPFLDFAKQILWDVNHTLLDLWYEANIITGISSYPAHLKIYKAVAAHDGRAACRAMFDHFDDFARAVDRHLRSVPAEEGAVAVAQPETAPLTGVAKT